LTYLLIIVCLIFPLGLHAQNLPKALSRVGKATSQEIRVSVAGYFHQLGSSKLAEREAAIPPLVAPDLRRKVRAALPPPKRSLESLQLEANAWGVSEDELKKMTREELEGLVTTYQVFFKIVKMPQQIAKKELSAEQNSFTRNDEIFMPGIAKKQRPQIIPWEFQQPDFFLGNYLPLDYNEPFHPSVKSLRILLISDDFDIISRIRNAEYKMENIHIDIEERVDIGTKHLQDPETKYDIIVTDFAVPGGQFDRGAYDVGMYVWNKKLNIPVILLTKADVGLVSALMHNIVGQYPYLQTVNDAHQFFNYLSNIVATGKAYPNELPPLLYYKQRLKELDRAIKQDPDNRYLYEQRGNVRRILGDLKGASADREKSEELFYSKH
ncbi:MAG: hypothetical protein IKP96_06430, partial [Elusimicrobiaceae bacterium]|nr:hypothetical protein [Elusimicrobiaceae bacterium]